MLSIIEVAFFAVVKLKDFAWRLLGNQQLQEDQESKILKDSITKIKVMNDEILSLEAKNLRIREEMIQINSQFKKL